MDKEKIIEILRKHVQVVHKSGQTYSFSLYFDKVAEDISNLVEARVSPKSTDIEKQENIVTILSDMITEIADRREILDTHFNCEYTHQEGRIIGSALKKLLALDNLKVITIE